MAFIANLRRRKSIIAAGETAPASQPSFGYIDTLFDYGALLAASPDSLGKLSARSTAFGLKIDLFHDTREGLPRRALSSDHYF